MSAHTGASALLALLAAPRTIALDAAMSARSPRITGALAPGDPHWPAARARRAARAAIRRLLRAHRGSLRGAARAAGVSAASLRAAAGAVGLEVSGRRERRRPRACEW